MARPKGEPNKGDVIRAKSTLRNSVAQFGKPKGAIVGSDVATFTVVGPNVEDVKPTAKLPGGTIRVAGRIREDAHTQSIRVTGGTGTFANAHGMCGGSTLGGDHSLNVYRLQLP